MKISDVQSRVIFGSFSLTRVGVKDIRKPITIQRPNKRMVFMPTINVYVDLPANQKGVHMSRNMEIINEVVDESSRAPAKGLENLCVEICKRLLQRHRYATCSECSMETPYFLEKNSFDKKSLEEYKLTAKAIAKKGKKLQMRRWIGVEVTGMTVCPCCMEGTKSILISKNPRIRQQIRKMPAITHNQRNISTVFMEIPENRDVDADDLITMVENSLSTPTYGILKRKEEAKVVYEAHKKPRFVEDVVREILEKIIAKYNDFPDSATITVHSESEESIHKHNAFAERATTFGELRK